ncbi:hypothetical protein [Aliiruegeria lutimaris]|uniref:DNA-binding transcriptional regulator, CsgD family n=1 Tax=Aliiruegeria lutimaris TaxID=571298 RepID=A0A1G9G9D9_9RHOB|nr:hypothetical protein [Aliiruegeria lutimaris]SDK97309.1 DNA-binding transcriptional regulator, CsgD family [Aliiruegeria lutimaris]
MSDRDAAEEVSLKEQLDRIEQKIDRMLGLYDALGDIAAGLPPRLVAALHTMSPAEHVALQMVLDNRSNHEISVCLDVEEPRVAEWVDAVLAKLGVNRRAEIRRLMQPLMAAIPPENYARASGGIPKDWNDKYGVGGVPDPYRRIYHPNPD